MAENTNYIGVAMGLDVTDLKAGLSEANKQIQLANSEFKAASSGMDNWTKSTEGLSAKVKQLDTVLNAQKSKLAGLEAEHAKVAKEQGENSEAARKLQVQINNQKAVVNSTQKEFDNYTETLKQAEAGTIDLEEVTLKAGKAISKTGKDAENAGDGFTVAKGAISTFAGNALTTLVSKAIEAGKAMFALAEETRDYRDDMAKLETAFKSGNHSVETASKTYDDFYKILGESDRTVEAVNHLAEFTDNTEELSKWGKIAAGVTAKFGDSLPIEGLTEAANETAKNGQITGVFADALNWAAKEGETFGVKLKANTAKNKEWNEAVKSATTAEEFFNLALQQCATEQERATLITNTLNGLYEEAGAEYNNLTKETQKAREATNNMEKAQAKMGETIQPLVTGWTNIKAQMLDWASNVVGQVIIGYQNLVNGTDLLTESQRASVTVAQENAQAYRDQKAAADELAQSQIADVDYVTNTLLPTLQNLVDKNGKVKQGEEERARFIMGELNQALGTEYTKLSDIIDANGQIKQSIFDVIEAKKAQILLEAYEESYRLAVKGVAEQEKARAIQAQEIAAQEAVYNDAHKKANDARIALDKKVADAKTEADLRALASEATYVDGLEKEAQKQKGILDKKKGEYNETESTLNGYYKNISDYETASTLIMKGETQKAVGYLNNVSNSFKTAEQITGKSVDNATGKIQGATKKQKKELEQQVIDTEVNARLMKEAYEDGVEGVTEDMVKTAEKQAKTAKKEFYKVGGDITKGIAEGAEEETWTLNSAMDRIVKGAVAAAKKAGIIKSPSRLMKDEVGRWLGLGVAKGIEETQSEAEKQIEKTTNAILSSATKNLSNFKVYNAVTLDDEIYYWNAVRKQIKEGTQARIDADTKYFELHKQKIAKATQYATSLEKIETDLNKNIQSLWDSYDGKLQSRTDAIANSMNLFAEVGVKVQQTPEMLTNTLATQVALLDDYAKNMEKLRERGVDETFIKELEAMGVNEVGNIRTLAQMTDAELRTYTALWSKKREIAAEQAKAEMAGEKKATEEKVAQLIETAETEMKALTDAYIGTAEESGSEIGEALVAGIEKGLVIGESTLFTAVAKLINKALKTAQEAADIRSPSKLFRKEVGVHLGEGIGVGILDSIPFVKKEIGTFNDYVASNLGNVKSNISAGISSNINGQSSGATSIGRGNTVIDARQTVNFNGNLSRKQLKQLENDNYTAIKTRLKAEGAI